MKCSQFKITSTNYYPRNLLSNFSCLKLHFARPAEVKNILCVIPEEIRKKNPEFSFSVLNMQSFDTKNAVGVSL